MKSKAKREKDHVFFTNTQVSSSLWRRRTSRWPCCSPISNPSTSPWTAWPDGSGRWDNRMAA